MYKWANFSENTQSQVNKTEHFQRFLYKLFLYKFNCGFKVNEVVRNILLKGQHKNDFFSLRRIIS